MKSLTGLLVFLFMAFTSMQASAESNSDAQLTITPMFCTVDLVQDGNNQTVQVPFTDCEAALSLLPGPIGEASTRSNPLFMVPIARQEPVKSGEPPIRSRVEGTLTPIATKVDQKNNGTSIPGHITPTVLGVGLALGATIVGIDIALFELHYSKSVAHWTRKHTTVRMFKK